ncbi:MAG: hypothetical protein Q9224_007702, partial [Gallowayella concinna]
MGNILGNILSGVVSQYVSWKWVFWILAMIACMVTVAAHYLIPIPVVHPPESDLKSAVDWVGGGIITVALFVLLFALTEGNIAMSFSSFNNYMIFSTYYYQEFKGLNPLQTMLRFLPTGPVGILTIIVVSQILARVKVNYIVLFGTICITISNLLFAVPISPDTTYWAYGFPAMCLSVMGADTLFPSLVLFNSHSLPQEDQGVGGALINAIGQVMRAIGLAIAIAIQVAVQESYTTPDAQVVSGTDN